MIRSDRRTMLGLVMGATLAPALLAGRARATDPGPLIAPPLAPMRYCRAMERGLADGSCILVEREFQVTFRRFAHGFIVEGRQVAVRVDAPASLAPFKDLERQRDEQGIFPLTLDPFGRISSEESGLDPASVTAQAFLEAERMIASQAMPAGERGELAAFVSSLHQTGTLITAQMPVDLFAPDGHERSEDVAIALPTGDAGRIVSRFAGERDQGTGLMRRARREVLTQVDGDTRMTVERWQLQSG